MLQPVTLGLLAAFVGFSSSFAVVLAGFAAMGATPAQAASGLVVLCLLMGGLGLAFSVLWRMPISIAWSTPGAALLVSTAMPEGGFPAAVGAFLVASALLDALDPDALSYVEGSCPLGAVELVAREGEGVEAEGVHVHGDLSCGLAPSVWK